MIRACLLLLAGMYAPQLSSLAFVSDHNAILLVAAVAFVASRALRSAGFVLLGAGLFALAVEAVVDNRIDPAWVGDSVLATVQVNDFPRRNASGVSFIGIPVRDSRLPDRIRISWFEPPVEIRAGDTWRLELRLRRPRAAVNPGVPDFEAWMTRERIGAIAYVVASPRNHLVDSHEGTTLLRLRRQFVERLGRVVADPGHQAVLAALVVGARHLLTPEQWEQFARSGTTHLMAISGLHVGLAAAGGYWLARLFGVLLPVHSNPHRVAVIASVLVAGSYALVSGLAVPAQRASVMLLLGALALLRRRELDSQRIVAAAAVALALTDPLATMSPGFRLSFGAVFILLWYARSQQGDHGPVGRVRQLATIQVLLLLGLLPLVAPVFGRITFGAPAVNLVAVPLFSVATVPLALAGLALQGPLLPIGDACLQLAGASLALLEPLLAAVAANSWLTADLPALSDAGLVLCLLPAVLALLPRGWPGRSLAWIGLAGLVVYAPRPVAPGCASATVLEVGQGLATVVETRSHLLVYDTGPAYRDGGSSAERVLLPYLRSRDTNRVDRLVVSHSDLDHAGGVTFLVDAMPIGDVLAGEPLQLGRIPVRSCVAGDTWTWDGVRFDILYPPRDATAQGNDASCVLRITADARSMLLPGDIERPAEEVLVGHPRIGPVDVVVMPHHGSDTSSSPALVAAFSPHIAIVPTAFGNRWGFPKPAVVSRWANAGAEVMTTGESGSITIDLCEPGDDAFASRRREVRRRIWHE